MLTEEMITRKERQQEWKNRRTIYSCSDCHICMVKLVKKPMLEAIDKLASGEGGIKDKVKVLLSLRQVLKDFNRIPEPREGIHEATGLPYVWHPNSITLIRLRDEFFTHPRLAESRLSLMRTFINFVIILYDYDPPYRMMIDWWAAQLQIQNWRYDIPITVIDHHWRWWRE